MILNIIYRVFNRFFHFFYTKCSETKQTRQDTLCIYIFQIIFHGLLKNIININYTLIILKLNYDSVN